MTWASRTVVDTSLRCVRALAGVAAVLLLVYLVLPNQPAPADFRAKAGPVNSAVSAAPTVWPGSGGDAPERGEVVSEDLTAPPRDTAPLPAALSLWLPAGPLAGLLGPRAGLHTSRSVPAPHLRPSLDDLRVLRC
ncbi:hypothetical protein ACFY84_29505 [Streptomyces sp. NPDC012438]|uniref:hypothetical protein n=1 Tax=Streptomyces sp. NPDC012438 TaxID=3364833 RepID=UPI0036E08B88